jgi:hypothetical protein
MRWKARHRVPTQHWTTMRDLARLDKGALAPQPIRDARELTEMRLNCQLASAASFLTVEKVMAPAFECNSSMARTFLGAMLAAFDRDPRADDPDLLYLIEDAWDYFPHRFLQGRCPAEAMTALFRDALLQA